MRQAVPDRGAIMKTLMTDFPSPAFRQMAYLIYTVVAVISGALQVAYSAGGWGQPVWLIVGVAVLSFLGGALGFTAASHVKPDVPDQKPSTVRPEVGAVSGEVQPIT
jgi:protein-S-isoprenylcysteine O-methyltransferase Ste14